MVKKELSAKFNFHDHAVMTSVFLIGLIVVFVIGATLGDLFTGNPISDSLFENTQTASSTLPNFAPTLRQGVASLGSRSVDSLFTIIASKWVDITDKLSDSDNFGNSVRIGSGSLSASMNDVNGDYSYHEEIRFSNANSITLETGLTYNENRHEDWKDNIFLPIPTNRLATDPLVYYYVFDEDLRAGNRITDSSISNPFQMEFLGENIEIISATSNTITLILGKTAILNIGEIMFVKLNGQTYTITLRSISGNTAIIDVRGLSGGQGLTINEDSSRTLTSGLTPIQVLVEDVFDEAGMANDRATITLKENTPASTYGDLQAYIGEDLGDPIWRWHLKNLNQPRPTIGVRLGLHIDSFDELDNPLAKHSPYVGDYICLPNFYSCVIFEKMSHDQFRRYTIDANTQKDLRSVDNQVTPDHVNMNVIRLKAMGTVDEGFSRTMAGEVIKSEALYLAITPSEIGVWREEVAGSDLLPLRKIALSGGDNKVIPRFAKLDAISQQLDLHLVYDKTPGEGLIIIDDLTAPTDVSAFTTLVSNPVSTMTSDLYQNILNDGDIAIYFKKDRNGFIYLGHSDGDVIVMNDLLYKDDPSIVDVSNWEDNTITRAGVIIQDPDLNNGNDEIKFAVPIRSYRALIRVAKPKQAVLTTTR